MEENVLEISIAGSRTIRDRYTEYEIVCITNSKAFGKCYTKVYRRYSDFLRLHCRLRCLVDILPEFPKKKWKKLCRNAVEERMKMLAIYMKFICDYVLHKEDNAEKIEQDVASFMKGNDTETFTHNTLNHSN